MQLLFTSGTARGGTNFRTLILNNHPRVRMSLDPFIPLFRFYRDSLLKSAGKLHLLERLSSSVLDDYYFSTTKIEVMKAVQAADPDIPFDRANWEQLKTAIASRMTLASMNLIPHLDKLPAPTFGEVFLNTRNVIAATTRKDLAWVGFNDNWAAEFIPIVAQLIPDARFMLHLRDPRAVVHSSEFAEPDPAKRPTIASFARHLRKYAALAVVLPQMPALNDRLLVTRYEPFLVDPEARVREMTDFLGIEYDSRMLDIDAFKKASGAQWASDWAIYKASGDVWRREMPRDMAEWTEFICTPDMRLHGYEPEIYDERAGLSPQAFAYAQRNARECLGWRTDFHEIEQTIGAELYRKRILDAKEEPPLAEIERCFLFPEVFRAIRQRQFTSIRTS